MVYYRSLSMITINWFVLKINQSDIDFANYGFLYLLIHTKVVHPLLRNYLI
jgi:hypothetical protein